MPLILAHGFSSLGEVLFFILLALLIPSSFVVGVLVPPMLLIHPHMFRPKGLPPLPAKTRRVQLHCTIVGILINVLAFSFWVSLFVHDSAHYPWLLPEAAAAFLGAEAVVALLRGLWCRHLASQQY